MESRIHGNMYVRFGGRSAETCCRKAVRRRKPSLLFITTFTVVDKETKEKIKYDDYKKLSEDEKQKYAVYPKQQVYNVFNFVCKEIEEKNKETKAIINIVYQHIKAFI